MHKHIFRYINNNNKINNQLYKTNQINHINHTIIGINAIQRQWCDVKTKKNKKQKKTLQKFDIDKTIMYVYRHI